MKEKLLESLLLISFLLLIFSPGGYAQGDSFANVAALLNIGVGARPLGMGGAFVGLADDENAVFYNPAALAFLDAFGITSYASKQFAAFYYGALGAAGRSIGLNLLQLYSGSIEHTNEFGNPDGDIFAYVSRAGIGALGITIRDNLAIGTRIKFYQEVADGIGGIGWAIDPAVMLKLDNVRIGAMFENALSKEIKFDNGHAESWNPDLRIGSSFSFELIEQATLNLLFDLSGILNGGIHNHIGVEIWANGLGVRAGVDGSAITVGTSAWLEAFRIDWAYATHLRLPDSNRLSVTFRF